jgi:tripartite-type tricarboxylate transporter receptor subunit TctC
MTMKQTPSTAATHRRRWLAAALAATGALAFGGPAVAQANYPDRPIRLLVGYSAGGGIDAVARLYQPRLSQLLGQQVVVENRAGAAGLIAGDLVAKAAPDGYTLLLGDSSTLIAQHLQPKMSFDPLKSFTPVAGLVTAPLVIVTGADFPARTPAEFISRVKAEPGKYSFATSGVGQVQHLGFELFKARTQTQVVHVPYKGAAQIVPDVMSGQVPIGVVSATAAIAQLKSGRLKAIAVMSPVKLAGAEEVPALADVLPGFDAAPRLFIAAPAGTPPAIVSRLGDAVRQVMNAPDFTAAALAQGSVPAYLPSAELAQDLVRESAMWGKVVKDQKITVE